MSEEIELILKNVMRLINDKCLEVYNETIDVDIPTLSRYFIDQFTQEDNNISTTETLATTETPITNNIVEVNISPATNGLPITESVYTIKNCRISFTDDYLEIDTGDIYDIPYVYSGPKSEMDIEFIYPKSIPPDKRDEWTLQQERFLTGERQRDKLVVNIRGEPTVVEEELVGDLINISDFFKRLRDVYGIEIPNG